MSDANENPYERAKAKAGRLAFKDGTLGTRAKTIAKEKKKKKKNNNKKVENTEAEASGGDLYTIDAANKKKYEELFPVETKKFGFDPLFNAKSVEEALDDRVKKKADRYCK